MFYGESYTIRRQTARRKLSHNSLRCFDHASADNRVAIIEYRCLAGAHARNRPVECDADQLQWQWFDHRGNKRGPRAYSHVHSHRCFQFIKGDEVSIGYGHLLREKSVMWSEDDPVRIRFHPDNIEPFANGNAEFSPLAHGKERNA